MPVEHLKKLKKNNTEFHVREITGDDKPTSSFQRLRGSNRVNLNVKESDTGADVSHQLIHEVGHAVDYAKDPLTMAKRTMEMRKPGADYGPLVPTPGNQGSHPVLEGIAEGYSAAHARITNTQKKTGGDASQYGYGIYNWKFPHLGAQFLIARTHTYIRETGKHYAEPTAEEPKQHERTEQPRLPGMEE